MATEQLPPTRLRTEYATDPTGIDPDRPRFGWQFGDETERQSAYHVLVASSRDRLADDRGDVWDSGVVETDRSTQVPYAGEDLDARERYYWKVRASDGEGISPWSDVATFETRLSADDWGGEWIGRESTDEEPAPAPLVRNEFAVDGEVERARAHVAVAGYCELHCNGERVGDRVLDTARTDYEERVLYATYDLTDALVDGLNAIGAELGRDWYALTTENVWGWERPPWHRDGPEVRLQIEVEYVDGSREVVATDGSWRTIDGPTQFDSVYLGERYDAREAITGWAEPGFDDSGWEAAAVVDGPDGDLVAQHLRPMTVVDRIEPVDVESIGSGAHVFDFGEVTAGWAELTVDGEAGTEVELTYGERRHEDGSVDVDQDHVEGTIQTDTYVLSGEGTETWRPRFSYKGFRYVEVRGFPGEPTKDALTAEIVHTPIEGDSRSRFESSNDLVNRIHENARRTFLNNCHGVPTDTPVFEKNGWTGDAQVATEMVLYNFDLSRFFTKWLDDFADAQRSDGEVPPIVPTSDWGYSDRPFDGGIYSPNPGWDSAYVLIPWWCYEYLGDERLLEEHYEGMRDVVEWLGGYADGHVLDEGLGDWLPPSHEEEMGSIPPEGPAITSTAYYYRIAEVVAEAADVLGRGDDREAFAALADEIGAAFDEAFLDAERGIYATGETDEYRQTSNVFPLAFGMVPDAHVERVVANLVDDVRETHDAHLNTGFHGTKYLLPVLTEYGHHDLAYEVATQTTYPSWGHWIEEHDAMTMYEAWELASRSRDHYAFGAIDEWFYEYLAGVRPAEPGFDRIEIAPRVPDGLDRVSAAVDTVRGVASVEWARENGFALDVSIPGNARATVRVPRFADDVRVDGTAVDDADRVTVRERTDAAVTCDVPAGDWTFTS